MANLEDDFKPAAEKDLPPEASRHIWLYFILLGVMLFATIGGLTIMFHFQVDDEKLEKIGEVETLEFKDAQAMKHAYLSGKIGLFADKKNIPVEQAMNMVVAAIREGK